MNIGNYQRQLSEWMEYKRYSPNSVKAYVSCIGKFLDHFQNEATKPSEISATKIKLFLTRFNQAETHKAYLSSIKLFYSNIGHQPHKLDKIEYPKQSKRLPIVLSIHEIQKMFDVCDNIKHKTALCLLYSCGLRISELINLEWAHIDRERMVINIVNGKGNKDRQVPFPIQIIPLLTKYYKTERSIKFVFNGQGKNIKYSATSIRKVVKTLAIKAGIKKRMYPHLIRHCTFTHMVEGDIDINLIQRIAGHTNAKTTMIYCHISDNIVSKIQSPISAISL